MPPPVAVAVHVIPGGCILRVSSARGRGKISGLFPPPFGRQPSNVYIYALRYPSWAPHSIAGWRCAFHTKGLGVKP